MSMHETQGHLGCFGGADMKQRYTSCNMRCQGFRIVSFSFVLLPSYPDPLYWLHDHCIQDLILRCLTQMVLCKACNIRSGWKSIVSCFACAAADPQPDIVALAFEGIL